MNPFEAFEKNAAAAGFSAEQIETLKKEALASVNPHEKQKIAAEQSLANYQEGFTKAAAEYGVAVNEAKELFKIATTVTVETLPSAIKTHFGRANEKTASQKGDEVSVAFATGFAKTAQAYGFAGEETADLLEKMGFDLASLQKMIQDNPTATGALGGGALGAGVGALAGGEGNRGKGALMGGLAGAGLGGGAGNIYGRGADSIGKMQDFADTMDSSYGSRLGKAFGQENPKLDELNQMLANRSRFAEGFQDLIGGPTLGQVPGQIQKEHPLMHAIATFGGKPGAR